MIEADKDFLCLTSTPVFTVFLLRLNNPMLRGDGEAVGWPGQIKAEHSGRVVTNLNLTGGGCTI